MKSDIEIAQSVKTEPISVIAEKAGIPLELVEPYGRNKAKIDLSLFEKVKKNQGKLVLVTAITTTPAGEGKTTTTIGLADALMKLGKTNFLAWDSIE